jgi:hypothetical protein
MKKEWLDNFVCVYKMEEAENLCQEVIERLKLSTRWNQSQTVGGADRYSRDSDQIYFEPTSPPVEHEPILAFAQQCLESYTTELKVAGDVPRFGFTEGYNLLRYNGDGSQAYHACHSDAGWPNHVHRHITFCMYLNDIEEGGETEFPAQGLKIKPETGKALIFPANWCYSHRSLPHSTGVDRYLFNIFYGFHPVEQVS